MIKCKSNPKKDGVDVSVKGKGIQIAVETLAIVKSVVRDVMSAEQRPILIGGIRSLLDELEENTDGEADTAEIEENDD